MCLVSTWLGHLLWCENIYLPYLRSSMVPHSLTPTCVIKFQLLGITSKTLYNQFSRLTALFSFQIYGTLCSQHTNLPPAAAAHFPMLAQLFPTSKTNQIKPKVSSENLLISQCCWLCHKSLVGKHLLFLLINIDRDDLKVFL